MKRQITIELEESDLKNYAAYEDQWYSSGINAIVTEAKKLYPQYEVGQPYQVTFQTPRTGKETTRIYYRTLGGWSADSASRSAFWRDGEITPTLIRKVTVGEPV